MADYVGSLYEFAPGVMRTSSVAEDWAGLRSRIAASDWSDRDEILALIDSDREPDNKEWKLKSTYPERYRYLLENVYPSLRHTDYEIAYTVRKYTDTDEIRRVMKERPRNLSLNELFIGATSYPEGSPEYGAAFELAASLFPDNATANLNAANAAMGAGNFESAERYLAGAGSGCEAEYARGTLSALRGDYGKALAHFRTAEAGGCRKASEAMAEIGSIESDTGTVTFYSAESR